MRDKITQTNAIVRHLAPKRGEVLLDLGCGTGVDMQGILHATRIKKVAGMDISEEAIAAAKRRLSTYVKRGVAVLEVGDAGKELPFASKSFDAVFSSELIECLHPLKQKRLLHEVCRVLKPRGRLLLAHTDWDTQVWNATDKELERSFVHAFCDWTQGWMDSSDGWMGRRILGVLRRSKLFRDVRITTDVLINDRYSPGSFGYDRSRDLLSLAEKTRRIRGADVRRFLTDLRKLDRSGDYFYSVNRYIAIARK